MSLDLIHIYMGEWVSVCGGSVCVCGSSAIDVLLFHVIAYTKYVV